MGQYWLPMNLTKREFIDPHKLGSGLKLWEMLANAPGVGAALVILQTEVHGAGRGGGDFDLEANWHGPERIFSKHNTTPARFAKNYKAVAKRTIGRWAGDRVVIVGDYAEDGDFDTGITGITANMLYAECRKDGRRKFKDITEDVCAVIEHELNGTFEGDGWRDFVWKEDKEVSKV